MKKKNWLVLLLLVIILPACGTVGVSDAATPELSMPLPDSEKTRITNEAPTFPVPGSASPSPTIQPVETQVTPLPTLTPSETLIETPVPSPTILPTETPIPTLAPSVTLVETPIPSPTYPLTATMATSTVTLISAVTPTSVALFTASPTPEPTQIDQAPQPINKNFLDAIKFLIWPGSLCFGGLLILALAIAMIVFQRRKSQPVIHNLTLGDLDPGWGYVEVSGRVTQIPQRLDDQASFPLDGKNPAPLAVLRLSIAEHDIESGEWKPLRDDSSGTPFLLNDKTGTAWIDPQEQEVQLKGDRFNPSLEQVRVALQILRLPPQLVRGVRLRYRIWVFRVGDPVTVLGKVQKRAQVLVRTDEQPLVLSAKNGLFPGTHKNMRPYSSFVVLAAVLGLLGLCISGIGAVLVFSRWLP